MTLIDAFSQCKQSKKISDEMRLLLVGRPGYQYDRICAHARTVPHGDAIVILPWVPSGELDVLYAQAAAFVFPSLYEGFGFPLLEALSYGIPVIASDILSLREIGGNLPVFAAPTADAFAEAMAAVAEKRPAIEESERNALLSRFSWEKSAEKTLTVLAGALS